MSLLEKFPCVERIELRPTINRNIFCDRMNTPNLREINFHIDRFTSILRRKNWNSSIKILSINSPPIYRNFPHYFDATISILNSFDQIDTVNLSGIGLEKHDIIALSRMKFSNLKLDCILVEGSCKQILAQTIIAAGPNLEQLYIQVINPMDPTLEVIYIILRSLYRLRNLKHLTIDIPLNRNTVMLLNPGTGSPLRTIDIHPILITEINVDNLKMMFYEKDIVCEFYYDRLADGK